jgi:hypothetical protein
MALLLKNYKSNSMCRTAQWLIGFGRSLEHTPTLTSDSEFDLKDSHPYEPDQ